MREPTNMGASVRARLLKLSKDRNQPFQLLLTRYVLERLLYRLSTTAHRDRFVLKGAMLMTTWFDDPFRPTQDLDLLSFGDPDPEAMLAVFQEICAIKANDGVAFDVQALTIDRVPIPAIAIGCSDGSRSDVASAVGRSVTAPSGRLADLSIRDSRQACAWPASHA